MIETILIEAGHAIGQGLLTTANMIWMSFYGLVFGFLISAAVQILVPERLIQRYASDTPAGIATMTAFGVLASSCNYATAAITRSLYRRGAGTRAAFAFLISSTNMNIAILVLAWSLLGWQFTLAEFLGGIIVIAVVVTGLSLVFSAEELERLRQQAPHQQLGEVVGEDVVCGMRGKAEHAVDFDGRTYLFCNAQHAQQFRADPGEYAYRLAGPAAAGGAGDAQLAETGAGGVAAMAVGQPRSLALAFAGDGAMTAELAPVSLSPSGSRDPVENRDVVCGMAGKPDHAFRYDGHEYHFCSAGCRDAFAAEPSRYAAAKPAPIEAASPQKGPSLRQLRTWHEIAQKFVLDVHMLRKELLVGYLVAGFASALVPPALLSASLHTIGQVPVVGYGLLLLLGVGLAIVTFGCSMANVPIARFLRLAGVPLGANITFIYGSLLIPPIIQIYRKSFAPKLIAAYLGFFVIGACIAGALMELLITHLPGGV